MTGVPRRLRIAGILAAAAVILLLLSRPWSGSSDNSIRVSGNIEMTEVKVSFKISGKLAERLVDEGDVVEKGAVVARLDQEQLLHQRDQARAALKAAESQLVQLKTAIDYQRATLAAQLEERRAAIEAARAQLAELEAGSRPQEIERARARLEETRTEFERARSDFERIEALNRTGDISRAYYDQVRARFEAARAQMRQAAEALALIQEGPRRETIESARARLEQAKAALSTAEALRLELRRREQELEMRRAEVDRARAQLALLESQLEDTVARSPVSGIVLAKAAEPGEVIAAGTTVVTIADLARPWLRAYITERDLGRVRLGARARLTTDSFPGKVYEGRVCFIASEAEFTPKQIQTPEERVKLVYRVKIEVDNPNQELKLNMPADAEILLEP
jgi:HlyD family secretion protein